MASEPSSNKFRSSARFRFPVLVAMAVSAGLFSGCSEEDSLVDVSCRPGDPASGQYDKDLPELCSNDIDDNCDGQVNEGCDCRDGEISTCGTDVGICESKTVACVNGKFPDCVPRYGPRDEACNGVDDDCDGEIDEGLAPRECWSGTYYDVILDGSTPCRKGVQSCENGRWSDCVGEVLPQDEQCNGRDDDCNGEVDDDPVSEGAPCGPAVEAGQCLRGTQRCHGGESICIGAVFSETEACDAIDNDCDGQIDEDLYRPCSTACGEGVEHCSLGRWIGCTAQTPQVEICDGFDNNCDGEADEGCPCIAGSILPCFKDVVDAAGNPVDCGYGLAQCLASGDYGPCVFAGTTVEVCNNRDDDCDGTVDGFTAQCGDPTSDGVGVCRLGTATCEAGNWGDCAGVVTPADEVCDGLDNDCDGLVDEDLDPHGKVDMLFVIDDSPSMCPYTQALALGISQYLDDFRGTEHRFALLAFPGDEDSNVIAKLVLNLSDVDTFLTSVQGLGCGGGGWEPSYDAFKQALDPANVYHINWRADAYPYVVFVTDEPAQTWYNVTESAVASKAAACGLPGCSPGDRVEDFVVTNLNYSSQYDQIIYGQMDRIYEIEPPQADRYTGILRQIFTNVCYGGQAGSASP